MLSRRTYIEINLKNYILNLKNIEKITGTKVIPVVKSNAYGCGAIEIAKISEDNGIEFIAVAFIEEAEKLRESGIKSKIIIFNYMFKEQIKNAVNKNYVITIYSIEQIKSYLEYKREEALQLKYHININTGINNLGINIEELDELCSLVNKNKINIDGAYTHFSSADSDEKTTLKQLENFKKGLDIIQSKGIKINIKHVANSAAIVLNYEECKMDYVRSGMALYGIQPSNIKKAEWIKNIIIWKSIVSRVRVIIAGETLNYGKNFTAEKDTKIAVIPVGYSDGYKTGMTNGGYVIIKNRKCYIKGMVCMDQITVEIPNDLEVSEEDEVLLLGGSGISI